jgi:hypothetical protein
MKTIWRFVAVSLCALLSIISVGSAATETFFDPHPCLLTGYTNSYTVTEVDGATGCVIRQYGIDCKGNAWEHNYNSYRPIPIDLGGPYTLMHSGFGTNGQPWWLKAEVNSDGRTVRMWGLNTSGGYYDVDVPTP